MILGEKPLSDKDIKINLGLKLNLINLIQRTRNYNIR